MLGWDAVEGLDWSLFLHSDGPATDTPGHLRALTSEDEDEQGDALNHLGFDVVREHVVYPATAPAARVTGGLLHDPRLRRPGRRMVLPEVLECLVDFAYSARFAAQMGAPVTTSLSWADVDITPQQVADYWCTPPGSHFDPATASAMQRLREWASADLFAALAELVDVVLPLAEDLDPAVSQEAVHLLTDLPLTPLAAPRSTEIRRLFQAHLARATTRERRGALLVGIGELGGDTRPWLDDDDPAIRTCAAVYLPTDRTATEVLLTALTGPRVDIWFRQDAWRHDQVQPRLLVALYERGLPFADVLPAAVIFARNGSTWGADEDWGLLLRWAFPDVVYKPGKQPPPPTTLDDAQRAFLRALAENPYIWNPFNDLTHRAHQARSRVGIPHTRQEVLALIGDAATSHDH